VRSDSCVVVVAFVAAASKQYSSLARPNSIPRRAIPFETAGNGAGATVQVAAQPTGTPDGAAQVPWHSHAATLRPTGTLPAHGHHSPRTDSHPHARARAHAHTLGRANSLWHTRNRTQVAEEETDENPLREQLPADDDSESEDEECEGEVSELGGSASIRAASDVGRANANARSPSYLPAHAPAGP
jgi:hypothetical protein